MDAYRRIADSIADDITAGRLRPGERLPPQRKFARRYGIAASTAERAYGELVRRGLVVGEVGRGTFVRAAGTGPTGRALIEPATVAPVNMELNYPSAPGQSELLAAALAPLLRPDVLTEVLRPASATGTAAAREAVAALLATPGWRPAPGQLLFTGNARQAIAAALACLVRPGGRVGVEALTYPLVKEVAARLGITLVPLPTDHEGLRPEAVAGARLSALYVQPTLHNPTSVSMSTERRRQLAHVVDELGLPVVEDRIWSFLDEAGDAPFAALAPHLTHVVDGLSKRVAPGLTVGFLVVPPHRTQGWLRPCGREGGAPDGSRWRRVCGGSGTGRCSGWWRRNARTLRCDSDWSPSSSPVSAYGPIRGPTSPGGNCPPPGARTPSRPRPPHTASPSRRAPPSPSTRTAPRPPSDSGSRRPRCRIFGGRCGRLPTSQERPAASAEQVEARSSRTRAVRC